MKLLVALGNAGAILFSVIALGRWRRAKISPWKAIGLKPRRRTRVDVLVGLGIGVVAMCGVFAVELVLNLIQVEGLRTPRGTTVLWSLLLPPAVFFEELVFRGFMLNGLIALMEEQKAAVAIMAVLYGLVHAGNPGASALSIVGNALGGVIYALAFLWSGSIWPGAGAHFAWDFVQGPLLGFPVSGTDMGGVVAQRSVARDLLTGGSYGPEAGLVGIASRFVALALLAAWFRCKAVGRSAGTTATIRRGAR